MFSFTRYQETSDYWTYLNKGEEDEMQICCFRESKIKLIVTYILTLLTGGILLLIFYWIPYWHLVATCTKCTVDSADKILIKEIFGKKHTIYYVKPLKTLTSETIRKCRSTCQPVSQVIREEKIGKISVHIENGTFKEYDKLLEFTCKKVTYIWNSQTCEFIKLRSLDEGVPADLLHKSKGLSNKEQFIRRVVYGPNTTTIRDRSVATLFFLEFLNPFYIFQIGSIILWFIDEYYIYPAAVIIFSLLGISLSVRQTYKNQQKLKSAVNNFGYCKILRKTLTNPNDTVSYETESISSELLVPGDVLVIPSHGCYMHCDAVLVIGNCITDESLLTGEAVPVSKTALPNKSNLKYSSKEHSKHTLFCGTKILQTRHVGDEKILAVVVRTGFTTVKGNLIRNILYPVPVDFKFERDSYKFIVLLAGVAVIGFIYTAVAKVKRGVPLNDIIVEAIDLLPTVIPPALPAAMTVGRFYAQTRLKKQNIQCTYPRSINVAGSVDCVCFDKTGTLTEATLDLLCVVPNIDKNFRIPIKNTADLTYDVFLYGLVTCHSLTIVNEQLIGNSLDLKMFENTKWVMEENSICQKPNMQPVYSRIFRPPNSDNLKIGVVREFPFTSCSKRMGVITQNLGTHFFDYYCKGSPKLIINFVAKENIPSNFYEILESYTEEGYRVIALAHKKLNMTYNEIKKLQRESIENDMTLMGLIVLENRLKPETAKCIKTLKDANIRVIMVTGDNLLTALNIARHSFILTHQEDVVIVEIDGSIPHKLHYTMYDRKSKFYNNSSEDSDSVIDLGSIESQKQCLTICNKQGSEERGGSQNFCYNYRFAVTGEAWEVITKRYPELLPKLLMRGSVFAEMLPVQKQQLVEELKKLDYCVAMCGDGANDCGALKTSHIGISLSEAESSIAGSFTSSNTNISCVLNVIREGRAALTTSFGIFKYMTGYSLCMFISVLILYSIESNLTTWEFLYIDLIIITSVAVFFGKNEAYTGKLATNPPLNSLISLNPILSLLLQMCVVINVQVGAFIFLQMQSWYKKFDGSLKESRYDVYCVENYVIFTVSNFQYILLAITFSKGKPYRRSMFHNYGFLTVVLVLFTFSTYLALWPSEFFTDEFEIEVPEDFMFRLYLVIYVVVNFILSLFVEHFIVEYLVSKKIKPKFFQKKRPKYLELERNEMFPFFNSHFTSTPNNLNSLSFPTAETITEVRNKS